MSSERIVHDQQQVYIFGERLRGVQSCSASWSAPEAYVNSIGVTGGTVGSVVEEALRADFEVERLMITPHDPMIDFFDRIDLSGEIHYGSAGNNFAFNGGYVTSYSCACAIGEIPSLNFAIAAYGDSGGGAPSLGRGVEKDHTIIVARPGSISLDVDGFDSNAIQSFEISLSVNKTPMSIIGDLKPVHFVTNFPIEVDCQFTLNVQDYQSSRLFDFICNPKSQNLNFNFSECAGGQTIRSFFMPSAKLVDYNQSAQIGSEFQATFTYKILITNEQNIKKMLRVQSF